MSLISSSYERRVCHGPSILDEYGLTPLARAVFDDKIDRVCRLISQGVHLEETMSCCPTALFVAVEHKRHAIAARLLEAGASTRARSETDKYSPLHLAAALGDVKMAQLLIAHGADMYALAARAESPVFIAAEVGCDELISFFIRHGIEPLFLRPTLDIAIFCGKTSIARLLIEAGADGGEGYPSTPLHTACAVGDKETAALLVSRGALLTTRDIRDITPLSLTMMYGHVELLSHLFIHERHSFMVSDSRGHTALHHAAHYGMSIIFERLPFSVEELEVAPDDVPQCVPICVALENCQLKTALAILKAAERHGPGAIDRQLELIEGHFPGKGSELYRAFLASETEPDVLGRTLLHYAVIWRDSRYVAELASSCFVDLDVVDKVHFATPLGYAVYAKNIEIVDLLLGKGASVHIGLMKPSLTGNSCYLPLLTAAIVLENVEIFERFIAAGADVNARMQEFRREADGTLTLLENMPLPPLYTVFLNFNQSPEKCDLAYALMKKLLVAGADPDFVVDGDTTIKQVIVARAESSPEYRRYLELF